MGFFRPTAAEIHLDALRHNFRQVMKLLPPMVRVMAMVKADAYGHGAVPVSRVLSACGAASLGVATVEEGLELRESAISTPVIVLGGLMGVGSAAAGMMIGANLTPVVHSAEVLDFLEATAGAANKKIGVHLKIDTGMTRLGVMPQSLPHLLNKFKSCQSLRLDGVMTHLADADDDVYTKYQRGLFKECIVNIEKLFGPIPIWHIANSAAVIRGTFLTEAKASEHWVRPGLMLYGSGLAQLKPVMMLKSKIVMMKSVPSGTKISYGCTFETRRQSRIGVVPIGYADGYPFSLSNKAHCLVRGKSVSVVGRVTMDMIMLDLTDLAESHVGDDVALMGAQNGQKIPVEEIAKLAGTIPYEIFCGVSKRMPRIYIGE
jgi:alanine racemase